LSEAELIFKVSQGLLRVTDTVVCLCELGLEVADLNFEVPHDLFQLNCLLTVDDHLICDFIFSLLSLLKELFQVIAIFYQKLFG